MSCRSPPFRRGFVRSSRSEPIASTVMKSVSRGGLARAGRVVSSSSRDRKRSMALDPPRLVLRSNQLPGTMLSGRTLPCYGRRRPMVEARIRVIYGDTDQMGVVYHANYFRYFELS